MAILLFIILVITTVTLVCTHYRYNKKIKRLNYRIICLKERCKSLPIPKMSENTSLPIPKMSGKQKQCGWYDEKSGICFPARKKCDEDCCLDWDEDDCLG